MINFNQCVEYAGGKDKDGYGLLTVKSTTLRVTRLVYRLHFGRIPAGMVVCHTCDNTSCFNPNHLFLGTNKDNTRDMVKKGRTCSGEKHSNCKLSFEQTKEMRELYQTAKYSQKDLALKFNIGQSHVSRIVRNERRTMG